MQRFQNILVTVDSRSDVHPALEWASCLAGQTRAKLKIMDVLPDFPWYARVALPEYADTRDVLLQEKRDRIEALATPLRKKGLDVATVTAEGKTSVETIREVLRGNHDLVVRVAKGENSRRHGFFGSTSFHLLRQCPSPVWIVKPHASPVFKHILGAVDPTASDEGVTGLNSDIVELARSTAQLTNGRFSLVHAWDEFGARKLLSETTESEMPDVMHRLRGKCEDSLDTFLAGLGMSIQDENVHLIQGSPPAAILEFISAHEVDLVVMGTVARAGLSGLLMGNTAELILNWVECPVLALKAPGFESTVRIP